LAGLEQVLKTQGQGAAELVGVKQQKESWDLGSLDGVDLADSFKWVFQKARLIQKPLMIS
jgi:hypothetical protein